MTSSGGWSCRDIRTLGRWRPWSLGSARYHTDRAGCSGSELRGGQDEGLVLHEAGGSPGPPRLADPGPHQTSFQDLLSASQVVLLTAVMLVLPS